METQHPRLSGLTRTFLFMGLPSSHSTTLVSFSFFWLQTSLSKPFQEVVSRKKMVTEQPIYMETPWKAWERLLCQGGRRASRGGNTRDCDILLYVLL